MDRRKLIYAPRAQRDLQGIERRFTLQILSTEPQMFMTRSRAQRRLFTNLRVEVLSDLELLETPPWPPGKVKKLRGQDFWEIKTGDFRTIFWPHERKIVILRTVNRRDLERTIERIDVRALVRWLRQEFGQP